MEFLAPVFPLYYQHQKPSVKFFEPFQSYYCGSVLVEAADSKVFISVVANIVPEQFAWNFKVDGIAEQLVAALASELTLAIPAQQEDAFVMLTLELRVLSSGGSDDLATALGLQELARRATIDLDQRVSLFSNVPDV